MSRFINIKDGERYIAAQIIGAQAASDMGKWDESLAQILKEYCPKQGQYSYEGYSAKVPFIFNAINAINSVNRMTHGHSRFSYYVVAENDQNGYASVLVYFEFKVYGRDEQVSFHTPYDLAIEAGLTKLVGKGRPTSWNRIRGGSRKAAERLLHRYFQNQL